MKIKPSTALRNEYTQISELAKETGEPIVITNKGEADLVIMSVAAFEEREKMFRHRDKVYEAEVARLSGMPTYTPEQIHAELEALYAAADK
jgi:prevent-host-death family protein